MGKTDPVDHEAIRRVLAGDPDAYRVLMDRHLPAVLRMTFRVTGFMPDAEEAAQEAFLRAYRKLPTFREDAAFGTWVYRIAMNCALNLVESRCRDLAWRAVSLQDAPHADARTRTPETLFLESEHLRERERLLACLTPAERSAFVIRHLEAQPVAAVAEALGTTTNNARQTIFRAVSKLREAFQRSHTPAQAAAGPPYLRRDTR